MDERNYWLLFSAFPGIGPLRFKLLLEYFGSAKKAWEADREELVRIGLGGKLSTAFAVFRKSAAVGLMEGMLKSRNIGFLTLQDEKYPGMLKEISDPPFVLYYRGKLENIPDWQKTIAVVGTRQITSYGVQVTAQITRDLALSGLTVVSGLAYGVDACAHRTALAAGGKTIAVLGCGADVIHPVSNTDLYWRIVKDGGVVLSEFPPGLRTAKGLFVARNRIVSGLSLGVVVTEGTADSGALITARCAAEQGREVFAVPGAVTSLYSAASFRLIKQGAKLVTDADDILEELDLPGVKKESGGKWKKVNISFTPEEKGILSLLENEDLSFDEMVRKKKISPSGLSGILTEMEIKGFLYKQRDGRYALK